MARLVDIDAWDKSFIKGNLVKLPMAKTEREYQIVSLVLENARDMYRSIMNAPTVDAVEVVRCRDCKFNLDGHCDNWSGWELVADDEFCSRGERREDGND